MQIIDRSSQMERELHTLRTHLKTAKKRLRVSWLLNRTEFDRIIFSSLCELPRLSHLATELNTQNVCWHAFIFLPKYFCYIMVSLSNLWLRCCHM